MGAASIVLCRGLPVSDTTHATVNNLQALVEGIKGIVPVPHREKSAPPFSSTAFTYDAE